MTSSNKKVPLNGLDNQPVEEKVIPTLLPEVQMKCVNGVYHIELPKLVEGKVQLGEGYAPTIQMRCQSLKACQNGEVHCCNSVVKTIVGRGRGDQTEIVECGKCRTSYVIRTKYDDNGKLYIHTSVWDVSRNLRKCSNIKRDRNYDMWVRFNTPEEKNNN